MTDLVDELAEGETLVSSSNRKDDKANRADAVAGLVASDLKTQSKLISARGTEEGLVLRIDGRADWQQIVEELTSFLGDRRKFLEGGEIAIEWLDRLPTRLQSQELELLLRDRYGIEIIGRKKKHPRLSTSKSHSGASAAVLGEEQAESRKKSSDAIPLFDSVDEARTKPRGPIEAESAAPSHFAVSIEDEARLKKGERDQLKRMNDLLGEDPFFDEEANARIVFGTLRSGQRVETPFSLIVVGDVNPGADLVAGGDIVVFGVLRGTAHAGAYDDEAQSRVILAQSMQPMQLRIGSVISRGNDDGGRGPEVARIEDRRIIVEAFSQKVFSVKRGR